MAEKLVEIEKLEAKRSAIESSNQRFSEEHIKLFNDQFNPLREWLGFQFGMQPSEEKIRRVFDFIDDIERTRLDFLNQRGKSDPLYLKWLNLLSGAHTIATFNYENVGRKSATFYQVKVMEEMRKLKTFEQVKKEEYKDNNRVKTIFLSLIDPINVRDGFWMQAGIFQNSSEGNPFENEVKKRFGETQEDQMLDAFSTLVHFVYSDDEPQAASLLNGLMIGLIEHANEQLDKAEKSKKEAEENKPKTNEFDSVAYVNNLIQHSLQSYEKNGIAITPAMKQMIIQEAQAASMTASFSNKMVQNAVQKSQDQLNEFRFSPTIYQAFKTQVTYISLSDNHISQKRHDLVSATIELFNEMRIGEYRPMNVANRLKYKPQQLLDFIDKQLKRTDENFKENTRKAFEIIKRNYAKQNILVSTEEAYQLSNDLEAVIAYGKYRNLILNTAYDLHRNGFDLTKGNSNFGSFIKIEEILALKGGDYRAKRLLLETMQENKLVVFFDEYRSWVKDKESLHRKLIKNPASVSTEESKILHQRYQNLVYVSSPYFSRKSISLDLKSKQRNMSDKAALVSFDRFESFTGDKIYYLVTTVSREGIKYKFLENGKELENKGYKSYINSIKYKLNDANSYNIFWEPIAEMIPNATDIYLVADGIYHKLNLHSLKDSQTNTYLEDQISFTYLTDIVDFQNSGRIANMANHGDGSSILIGRPDFGKKANDNQINRSFEQTYISRSFANATSISDLPATEVEVKSISNLLTNDGQKVTLYLGGDASEENLKSLENPNLLHIATHGFFEEDLPSNPSGEGFFSYDKEVFLRNPLLRSGLVLAGAEQSLLGVNQGNEDGIVTAQEVAFLSLEKTKLVTLSACETGLGEVVNGEGVLGLQRSFLLAGADAILTSLWEVDDEATQKLMTSLYENWLVKKVSLRQAFKEAKTVLREEYSHPNYWSAFVLMENQ